MAELLKSSDIVSIHAPLNPQIYNLLQYDQLKTMKKVPFCLTGPRGHSNNPMLRLPIHLGLVCYFLISLW
ncbi:MAG: NAD(P)-dependent oxidoreductase [Syntrophomonadaceae bacterium]